MEDNIHQCLLSKNGAVAKHTEHLTGGYTHRLTCFSKKSKRISHSTSHAETLACVSASHDGQLLALRFTELLSGIAFADPRPLDRLLEVSDSACYTLPLDHVTDCHDLLELVCGIKGVPSDKTQRLSILAIREDRLSRRIRHFLHVPTNAMIMDGLTKTGTYPELLRLLSSGFWRVWSPPEKHVTIRTCARKDNFDEQDLLDLKS